MKCTTYSYKTKIGLATKIVLITLVAHVSLNPVQAHEHGEQVAQEVSVSKAKLCPPTQKERRNIDQLLEIVTTNLHEVVFYDTTGNHQRHVNSGGKIKLISHGGKYKKMKIKMKHKGQRKWELKDLVNITNEVKPKRMLLGDIISIEASTDVVKSSKDQVFHKYRFDFYVPCNYETVGYFMFDFWDVGKNGQPIMGDENHNIIPGPIEMLRHSRGTGGGQSN